MSQDRKTRWNEFLMDSNGEFSFKRILPAVFSIVFIIYVFVNLFTGKVLDSNALDLIMFTILGSLTAQTIEPFSKFRRTTVVSKDTIVTQDANPVAQTAVSEAVEKIIDQKTTTSDNATSNTQTKESQPVNKEQKPELLE